MKQMVVARLEFDEAVLAAASPDGLMRFRFTLTTSGGNLNKQFFVEDELSIPSIYESPIGEAVDVDHDQNFWGVVGEIYDSVFQQATYHKKSRIRCEGVVFEDLYPDVAMKARRGAGRWAAVSMEAIPNPLKRAGEFLVIHMPKFIGAGLVRFPGNLESTIDEVDGQPVSQIMSTLRRGTAERSAALRAGSLESAKVAHTMMVAGIRSLVANNLR